jgi:conjugal transfer pilus assembly protein TraF
MRKFVIAIFFNFACMALTATANEAFVLECDGDNVTGWSYYCEPPVPEEEEETEELKPEKPTPPQPQEQVTKYPATEKMEEFRAVVNETLNRAVLDPTEENVLEYMEINKLMGTKAGKFTDVWQRVLFKTPHLDANTEYPLAQAGITVYQDQMRVAQTENFRRVAETSGILFVFEDDNRCGMCRKQGEVLKGIEQIHGVSILAVSRDGGQNAFFPNARIDDGRLAKMGLAADKYPAPTMALINPQTKEIEVIGSGILTEDTILERVFVITQIPVGERY